MSPQNETREVVIHWDWEPLPDDAIVIRGGPMTNENMSDNAAAVFAETNSTLRGICGGAAPPPRTWRQITRDLAYRGTQASWAMLGQLRTAGFDVVMIDDPPHCVILLHSDELEDDWEGWDTLRALFHGPSPIEGE